MTNQEVLKIKALLHYKHEMDNVLFNGEISFNHHLQRILYNQKTILTNEFWRNKFQFQDEYKNRYCMYKDEIYVIRGIHTSIQTFHILIHSLDSTKIVRVQFDEIDIFMEKEEL